MPANHITEFSSLSALVEHVKRLPEVGYDSDLSFYGATWPETYNMAERGWFEGAKAAAEMSTRIADRTVQHSSSAVYTDIVYDVTGAAYDPGAYISGVPECWIAFQPYEAKRSIRIIANIAVSCAVDIETFKRRGIAISALALALNAQGHPITVDIISSCKPNMGGSIFGRYEDFETIQFRAADAYSGAPLDIDRLVYSLAHPSVFRRLCSAATNGFKGKTCGTKWGSSMPPLSGETIPDLGEYDLFLGAGHIYDVKRWNDGGEQWVLDEYIKQTEA